jgi:hypothetical protein
MGVRMINMREMMSQSSVLVNHDEIVNGYGMFATHV